MQKRTYYILLIIMISLAIAHSNEIFPEGDIIKYIDTADSIYLAKLTKGYMRISDYYESGDVKKTEGFFIRKKENVVFVQTKPESQKNFAILRIGNIFYSRLANTGKVVHVSATQKSRGGETTNLDITRFTTNQDYKVKYLQKEKMQNTDCYKFELKAKNRKLAYSLVHLWINIETKLPVKKNFYASSGKLLKYAIYTKAVIKKGQMVSAVLNYYDALNEKNNSELVIDEIVVLKQVPQQFFTKEFLESRRLYNYNF